MKRKLISMMLTIVLCVSSILPVSVSAGAVSSGTCGDSLRWEVTDDVLTISGTGEMYQYSAEWAELDDYTPFAPWYAWRKDVTSVVIEEGVTSISARAFSDFDKLVSVTISSTVESIGDGAFALCENLVILTIMDGVESIGDSAFRECVSLSSVTIPGSVTTIGESAFYACGNLRRVALNEGVRSIENGAFGECNGLTVVTIPASVTTIVGTAFPNTAELTIAEGNKHYKLEDGVLFTKDGKTLVRYPAWNTETEYVIPDGVTAIGDYAFERCERLKSVSLPDGVTTIGKSAFDCCTKLETMVFPDTVKSIGESAFFCCFDLKTVEFSNGVSEIGDYAFSSCESLTELNLPDGTKSIGEGAFSWCTALEKVAIPGSVEEIGSYAFDGCEAVQQFDYQGSWSEWQDTNIGEGNEVLLQWMEDTISDNKCGESVFWELSDDGVLTISGEWKMFDYSKRDPAPWYADRDSIKVVEIENESTAIDGVTSIGDYAFAGCKNLSQIIIASSVTSIGENAFDHRDGLRVVYYGTRTIEMPEADWEWLTEEGKGRFEQPLNVEYSGKLGKDESALEWRLFGGTLTISGQGEIPDYEDVEEAPWYKIKEYENLITSITIGEEITRIGDYSFACLPYLKNVSLPDTLEEIGVEAFAECEGFRDLALPASLITIDSGAFFGCPLFWLVVPAGVESIGSAIVDSSVSDIRFEGAPPKVQECCETDGAPFKHVTYEANRPASVIFPLDKGWTAEVRNSYGGSVLWGAVDEENSLLFADINGTPEEWEYWPLIGVLDIEWEAITTFRMGSCILECKTPPESMVPNIEYIEVEEDNPVLTSVDGVVFNKDRTTLVRYPVNRPGDDYMVPEGVELIWDEAFSRTTQLKNITMADSVAFIGMRAFAYGTLESVVLGDNVQGMGESTFFRSTVSHVVLPEGLMLMHIDTFSNCENLNSAGPIGGNYDIQFGWKTEIPDSAFCTAFGENPYLKTIHIPNTVKNIEAMAFWGCTSLEEVKFVDAESIAGAQEADVPQVMMFARRAVEERMIDERGFCDCTNITEFVIPAGYTTLNDEAFRNCQKLESIVIPDTVTYIGARVFDECPNLKSIRFDGTAEQLDAIEIAEDNSGLAEKEIIVNHVVIFETNDGTYVENQEVAPGESAVEPEAPTKDGYIFGGWYLDENCTTVYDFSAAVTADTVLYAKWTAEEEENPVPAPGDGKPGSTKPSYTVTIERPENGSIVVNNSSAKAGEKVSITLTPDEGFVLDSLTILDKNGNAIEVMDNGDGTYTFEMPAGKIFIQAEFVQESVSNPFGDVAETAYYYDAVQWAAEQGITTGLTPTAFGPDESCTRAQVVTFLWRAMGCPEAADVEDSFGDVETGSYYETAVQWALEQGITNGVGNGGFGTEQTVTRSQLVTFLWRCAGCPDVSDENPFFDIADGQYYTKAVIWAASNGITTGTGEGKFSPNDPCTRGQIVTFLYRDLAE